MTLAGAHVVGTAETCFVTRKHSTSGEKKNNKKIKDERVLPGKKKKKDVCAGNGAGRQWVEGVRVIEVVRVGK